MTFVDDLNSFHFRDSSRKSLKKNPFSGNYYTTNEWDSNLTFKREWGRLERGLKR